MVSTPIKVLFVHGLESRPGGTKTRLLRAAGFDVVAPDLEMGLLTLRRKHALLRELLRLPEVVACVGASLITGAMTALAGSVQTTSGVGLVFIRWLLVRRKALTAAALRRSFDASLRRVTETISTTSADVLVGSSWGGAVAAEAVARGAWAGPTILLAPALGKVREWTRASEFDESVKRIRERASLIPIMIFHDPTDETIPFAHSAALAEGTSIDLRAVSAGGHRLLGLIERGELAAAINELVSSMPQQ
jgi:pimeloyl-ACP methyl ester carboxylesterase